MIKSQTEMPFFEHFSILRKHLIRSAIAFVVFSVIIFVFFETIFHEIILGPKSSDFLTYQLLCYVVGKFSFLSDDLCIKEIPFEIINIKMAGQFLTKINTSFLLGLTLSIPYVIWELWKFIKPGLKVNERKATSGFSFWASLLFSVGILFGYFILTPLSINFLANFSISSEITNQITVASYFSTMATLTLVSGIFFELPLIVFILFKIGLLNANLLRKYRRYAIVMVLVLAAIITPTPDIVTMSAVSLPMYLLYELSIFIIRKPNKNE